MKNYLILILVPLLLSADALDDGKRWWTHVQFLADDKLEGRNTGSEGHRKAAQYVADQFERAGLRPAGKSYLQTVPFQVQRIEEAKCSVEALRPNRDPETLKLGDDVILSARGEYAKSLEVEAVFADLQTVHPIRKRPKGEVQTYTGKGQAPMETEGVNISTEDYGAVMFRFKGGAKGTLHASQVTAGRKNCLRYEVAGAKCSVCRTTPTRHGRRSASPFSRGAFSCRRRASLAASPAILTASPQRSVRCFPRPEFPMPWNCGLPPR